MAETGARRIVPKNGIRIEIDKIGDLKLSKCGKFEKELARITIRQGGQVGIVWHETNDVTVADVDCERALDLEDRSVSDWEESSENTPGGDHRNGTVFYVVKGVDVAKRELLDVLIGKHADAELDADAIEDKQMETFTLHILKMTKLEKI